MVNLQRPPNYILKITLVGTSEPTICRTLSVPCDYTFDDLHHAIQVAFGWTNTHLYKFDIVSPRTGESVVSIEDQRDLPIGMDFDDDWPGTRQWSPDTPLTGVLGLRRFRDKKIIYLYDFGDHWEHEIEVVGRTTKYEAAVTCMAGEGHPCAEDVGGPGGWHQLKRAYLYPRPTNAQRERCEWYENYALNGDARGLGGVIRYMWDIDDVNCQLAGIITFHEQCIL